MADWKKTDNQLINEQTIDFHSETSWPESADITIFVNTGRNY